MLALRGTREEEEELVERARQGDAGAFESLYRRHVDRVHALCLRMSGDAAAAEELTRDTFVRAWAGLEPVYGPGVTITIDGRIAGSAVEDLLNELRNAGTDAIAVEDVRLVPGVVVAGAPGELVIGGRPLPNPFEIRAIGSPETLTGSLTRIGGVIAVLQTVCVPPDRTSRGWYGTPVQPT